MKKKGRETIKGFRSSLFAKLSCIAEYEEVGIFENTEKLASGVIAFYFGVKLKPGIKSNYILVRCYNNGYAQLEERVFDVNFMFNMITLDFFEDFDEAVYQAAQFIKEHP
jgi:hypothetical protein